VRPPRMTVRRWSRLVGVLAAIMAGMVWQTRGIAWRAYCKEKVEYHTHLANSWRKVSEGHARHAEDAAKSADDLGETDKKRRWLRSVAKSQRRGAKYIGTVADYHMQMTQKWSNAANSLWLTAVPDPPEP
jgi:hypothetical protein